MRGEEWDRRDLRKKADKAAAYEEADRQYEVDKKLRNERDIEEFTREHEQDPSIRANRTAAYEEMARARSRPNTHTKEQETRDREDRATQEQETTSRRKEASRLQEKLIREKKKISENISLNVFSYFLLKM